MSGKSFASKVDFGGTEFTSDSQLDVTLRQNLTASIISKVPGVNSSDVRLSVCICG